MVLQRSKTAGWDCYLNSAGMDVVGQDPHFGCCKPLPTSQSRFQWLSHTDSPAALVVQDQSWCSQKEIYNAFGGGGGCWFPPWGLFPHWRNQRFRGDLSAVLPGGGATRPTCGCFSYPSNANCLGRCGTGDASASPSYARILSDVFSLNSCFPCDGEQSQSRPMPPSLVSHFPTS